MNKSNVIEALTKALAQAQAEMPAVKMNSVNPFLKNSFADLGAVIETSRPVLAKYGLSISQFPTSQPGMIGVTTILSHASGQYMEDTIFMPLTDEKGKSAAQVAGSIITYLRRYAWSAVLGLYADEDTDGNQAGQGKAKASTPAPAATKKADPPQADGEKQTLRAQFAKVYNSASKMGIKNLPSIEPQFTAAQIQSAIDKIVIMTEEVNPA